MTLRAVVIVGVIASITLSGCGGGNSKSKSTTSGPAPVKTSGNIKAEGLRSCLESVSAKPKVSTDNQLYAPMAQDPDFVAAYDAWRGTEFPQGYSSIYLFIYKTPEGAGRAIKAQAADSANGSLSDQLIQVDNVAWTTD